MLKWKYIIPDSPHRSILVYCKIGSRG
jgi:hypothetical protein